MPDILCNLSFDSWTLSIVWYIIALTLSATLFISVSYKINYYITILFPQHLHLLAIPCLSTPSIDKLASSFNLLISALLLLLASPKIRSRFFLKNSLFFNRSRCSLANSAQLVLHLCSERADSGNMGSWPLTVQLAYSSSSSLLAFSLFFFYAISTIITQWKISLIIFMRISE